MRRVVVPAVVAAVALVSSSGRAEAQVFSSYGAYFPGGGRAFPGATGYLGYYADTPYPNDLPFRGLGFTFGRVPPVPAVPPPPAVYLPREGTAPNPHRWAPARYWRKL